MLGHCFVLFNVGGDMIAGFCLLSFSFLFFFVVRIVAFTVLVDHLAFVSMDC